MFTPIIITGYWSPITIRRHDSSKAIFNKTDMEAGNDDERVCGYCQKQKGTKKCGGCKQIYYCSQQCQIDHWQDHKSECKKIRKQNKLKKDKEKSKSKSKGKTLNNTIAQNMKLQYDKENKKRRTPRIKVTKAVNGIFKVRLLNEFLRDKRNRIEFQFDYKYLNADKEEWITNTFTSQLIEQNGYFAVRMPLNLKGYYIKCRLRARLMLNKTLVDKQKYLKYKQGLVDDAKIKETEEKKIENTEIIDSKWFDYSKEYKVSIPSSMIGTEFEVGDIVKYRPEDDYVVSYNSAQLMEKLENGYVKIKEIKSADIPGLKINPDPFILHQSRISLPDNIKSRNLLDFTNLNYDIDKTLLLKLKDDIHDKDDTDDHRMKVYKELVSIYRDYGNFWKLLTWETKKRLDFYVFDIKPISIGRFIALNVMNYLFECNEYEWKFNSCILDHKHGPLTCNECLRSYFIKRNIEDKGCADKERERDSSTMDGRYQICDVCSITVDQFEYIYHCSTKMEDRHDICLNCMYSMIKQSNELNNLLIDILMDNVNNDCIDVIVSFVVGKVVKIS